jgi:hypothetical protein
LVIFWIDLTMKFPHYEIYEIQLKNANMYNKLVYFVTIGAKLRNYWLWHEYIFILARNKLIWLIKKNDKIAILSQKFMPFIGNKSSSTIFDTFVCRFHILPALSE